MSKVTYFSARQKVLEVIGAGVNIAFTAVPCAAFVPAGATALIVITELVVSGPGNPGDYAISTKRKNAAQGVCSSDLITDLITNANDNAIIPLTTTRQFEYDLNGVFAALTVNIKVYAIGYLS